MKRLFDTISLIKLSLVSARQTSVWLVLTWSTELSPIQSQSLSFDGNLHISGDIFYQQWRSYDLYYFFKLLDQGIFCCEFIFNFKHHKFLEISLDGRMFTKSLRLNAVSYRVKLRSVCLTQSLIKSSFLSARQTSVWLVLTWSTQFSPIQSQSLSFDGPGERE